MRDQKGGMGTEEAQTARAALALRTCEAEVAGLFGAHPPCPLPLPQRPPRRPLPISPPLLLTLAPSLRAVPGGNRTSLTVAGDLGAQRTCRRAWRLCGRGWQSARDARRPRSTCRRRLRSWRGRRLAGAARQGTPWWPRPCRHGSTWGRSGPSARAFSESRAYCGP